MLMTQWRISGYFSKVDQNVRDHTNSQLTPLEILGMLIKLFFPILSIFGYKYFVHA